MTGLIAATGLSPLQLIAVMVMALGAAAIRGLTGFGMAIILVPLLCIVIRPDEAVILAILLQFMIGPVGIRTILRDMHLKTALPIILTAVMATPFGIYLLAITPPDIARLIIAGIAIGAFLMLFVPQNRTRIPGTPVALASGVLAGILTGFAAMPGPPVVIFYIREAFSAHTARASMMLVFFATATTGTFVAALGGLIEVRIIILAFIMLIPMLVGNWAGAKAFGRISPPLWRGAVAVLLGVAGLSAVVRLFT